MDLTSVVPGQRTVWVGGHMPDDAEGAQTRAEKNAMVRKTALYEMARVVGTDLRMACWRVSGAMGVPMGRER